MLKAKRQEGYAEDVSVFPDVTLIEPIHDDVTLTEPVKVFCLSEISSLHNSERAPQTGPSASMMDSSDEGMKSYICCHTLSYTEKSYK